MRPAIPSSLVSLVVVTLTAGCSSPPDAGSTTDPGGSGGSGGTGGTGETTTTSQPPSVHFFVNERPQDDAVKEIEAAEARWADPIRIVASGLLPGLAVRIDVSTGAWGVFAPDGEGRVDLASATPLSGTWSAADLDGPFWSAPVAPKPIFDITVTVSDAEKKQIVTSGMIHRRPLNVGVSFTKVNAGTRVGTISRPADMSTKKPAFLAFGGSEGGTYSGEIMAYYLSQLGYVGFGVGYFGAPGLPANLEQVPLEILKDDLDYLASQADVDPDRIAVLGGSRGGELALLLGATFPDRVHTVVADVPSGYVWGATTGKAVSAWTYGGVDLPFVPSSGALSEQVKKNGKTYWAETPAFLADIAAAPESDLEAARIPVEKTQGPIFLTGGGDDQLWPSCVLAKVAWDALEANKHTAKFGDELHCQPDAGHFSTLLPGSSTVDSDAYYSVDYKLLFLVGGTPAGNARAQRMNNTAMRKFLDKAFGKP